MSKTDNYNNRCAAFKLSEAKRQTATIPPQKKPAAATPTGNAYERAYNEVFSKLVAWRQKEIVAMREAGNTSDRHYMDFVKEVAALGDKYHG